MAIFYQQYLAIPQQDYKKTTLGQGNPHRLDHQLLGAAVINASLYKPPKSSEVRHFWLWDDPQFDPMDPQPSERVMVKSIYDSMSQEMERVQQDRKVRFPEHHIVGNRLQRQLGFLYDRSCTLQIATKELLYHVILGSIPIELSQVVAARLSTSKTLKPVFLPSMLSQFDLSPLSSQQSTDKLYNNFDLEGLQKQAESDVHTILQLYYKLNSSI